MRTKNALIAGLIFIGGLTSCAKSNLTNEVVTRTVSAEKSSNHEKELWFKLREKALKGEIKTYEYNGGKVKGELINPEDLNKRLMIMDSIYMENAETNQMELMLVTAEKYLLEEVEEVNYMDIPGEKSIVSIGVSVYDEKGDYVGKMKSPWFEME